MLEGVGVAGVWRLREGYRERDGGFWTGVEVLRVVVPRLKDMAVFVCVCLSRRSKEGEREKWSPLCS